MMISDPQSALRQSYFGINVWSSMFNLLDTVSQRLFTFQPCFPIANPKFRDVIVFNLLVVATAPLTCWS